MPLTLSSVKNLLYRRKTFCVCFPLNTGVTAMSSLMLLLSTAVSILLWIKYSERPDGPIFPKTLVIVSGTVEIMLSIASVLCLPAIALKKQICILAYAYFIPFHLLLNLVTGLYFLVIIIPISVDERAVLMIILLASEIYTTIIMARYIHQVNHEKQMDRLFHMVENRDLRSNSSRVQAVQTTHTRDDSCGGGIGLLTGMPRSATPEMFNPYEAYSSPGTRRSSSMSRSRRQTPAEYEVDPVPPPPFLAEEGYGGGTWTYAQVEMEEKERLKRLDRAGLSSENEEELEDADEVDVKSLGGPSSAVTRRKEDDDNLPRYTARTASTSMRHGGHPL